MIHLSENTETSCSSVVHLCEYCNAKHTTKTFKSDKLVNSFKSSIEVHLDYKFADRRRSVHSTTVGRPSTSQQIRQHSTLHQGNWQVSHLGIYEIKYLLL